MASIYLIRHGQASASQADYDKLSATGIEQAKKLAPYLTDKISRPQHIQRGSMLRHEETATHAASHFDIEAKISANWNEYDHQAILTAYNSKFATPDGIKQYFVKNQLPKSHFQTLFLSAMEKWIQTKDKSDKYPETWQEFTQRVLSAFEQLSQEFEGKNALVFTSGGPISVISCHLLGLPLEHFMRINWNLVNAGLTKVLLNTKTKNTTLSSLNEHNLFELAENRHLMTYS